MLLRHEVYKCITYKAERLPPLPPATTPRARFGDCDIVGAEILGGLVERALGIGMDGGRRAGAGAISFLILQLRD